MDKKEIESKEVKSRFQKGSEGPSWEAMFRICASIFITFVCCILFFFIVLRFQGFAQIWKKLLNASQSIIIGLMMAFIFNPIMKYFDHKSFKWLEKKIPNEDKRHVTSRMIGIVLCTFILLASLALLGVAILPAVYNSIIGLIYSMNKYVNTILDFIQKYQFGDEKIQEFFEAAVEQGADYLESFGKNTFLPQAQNYITQITTGVYNVIKSVLNFIIGIIVMDYVMAIQGRLSGQVKKTIYAIFPAKQGNIIVKMVRKISEVFGGFITGKLIDSVIIGVIAYIGCSIMKTPDTVLVAVIIGVTNIIPFFGPFIGAIPSIILVLVQNPMSALYLSIFILVLQQVDGNIIGPKILGSSTGLSSFWVLVSILIGGGMFGLAGMIFGVPACAILYYVVSQLVNRSIRKKGLTTNTRQYTTLFEMDEKNNVIIAKDPSMKKIKK